MGNQQNLSPRVAERVFEAVFSSFMGCGTAWGGRLPCKQDIQVGSIPTRSTYNDCNIVTKNGKNVIIKLSNNTIVPGFYSICYT